MYISATVPFANAYQLQAHFDAHGREVGATSEQHYESMADAFMSQAPHSDLFDGVCIAPRSNGFHDRIRLNGTTRWFGIAYSTLTVRTLHRKKLAKIVKAGGPRAFVDKKCLEIR